MKSLSIALILLLADIAQAVIQQEWVRQFGDDKSNIVADIAFDEKRSMLYAATNYNEVDNKIAYHTRVDKIDPNGTFVWTHMPGSETAGVFDVAVSGGAAYFTSFDFNFNINVTKLTKKGKTDWSTQLTRNNWYKAYVASYYPTHSLFVLGTTMGVAIDGQNPIIGSCCRADIVLFKLDKTGTKEWTRVFGSTAPDVAVAVAVDPQRHVVYIWALVTNLGNLGDEVHIGHYDCALIAVNADTGDLLWQHLVGGTDNDTPVSMTVDTRTGDIYISGHTVSSIDGNVNQGGASDVFVMKYDFTGARLWTRYIGGAAYDFAVSLDIEPNANHLLVLGGAYGAFDGQTLVNSDGNGADSFMTVLDLDGSKLSTTFLHVMANQVAVNFHTGDIYLAGFAVGAYGGQQAYGGRDAVIIKNPSLQARRALRGYKHFPTIL